MEPFNDRELRETLRQWKAPDAPVTLRERVWRAARLKPADVRLKPDAAADVASAFRRTLRWLTTGTIRIPVPVGLALVFLAAAWIYFGAASRPRLPGTEPVETNPVVSLADFKPVEEVETRVVGEWK